MHGKQSPLNQSGRQLIFNTKLNSEGKYSSLPFDIAAKANAKLRHRRDGSLTLAARKKNRLRLRVHKKLDSTIESTPESLEQVMEEEFFLDIHEEELISQLYKCGFSWTLPVDMFHNSPLVFKVMILRKGRDYSSAVTARISVRTMYPFTFHISFTDSGYKEVFGVCSRPLEYSNIPFRLEVG